MEEFLAKHPTDLVARRTGAVSMGSISPWTPGGPRTSRRRSIPSATSRRSSRTVPTRSCIVAFAHLRAAMIYREQDRPDWADELERADAAIKRMEARVTEPGLDLYGSEPTISICWTSTEKALATLKEGHKRMPDDRGLNLVYAMALYRAGEPEQALEVLEGAAEAEPILWLDLPRALLLAEQADRRDEAAALARSLARRRPPGSTRCSPRRSCSCWARQGGRGDVAGLSPRRASAPAPAPGVLPDAAGLLLRRPGRARPCWRRPAPRAATNARPTSSSR